MDYWIHKTAEVSPEAKIGKETKIWHNSQVLAGAKIGDNCSIGHNCLVGGKAKIGHKVKIESNTDVWDLVTLGNYVFVGPSAVFTNDPNPRARYPKRQYSKYGKWLPTFVGEGASIGANATIVCGHTIGRWAFIGAGAVVTENVPNYAIVVGVPAKIIGWMCECGNKLEFRKEKSICKKCKKQYAKKNDEVNLINLAN